MIVMLHNDNKVVNVYNAGSNKSIVVKESIPIKTLFNLAELNRGSLLIWCHESQKHNINIKEIKASFILKNTMQSFATCTYLPQEIGYVEDSPFLKINTKVKYPTWLMSSQVGAIYASTLLIFKGVVDTKLSLDYALNSIAKLGMPKGLFCYSNPKLVLNLNNENTFLKQASISTLFTFVKAHYKFSWVILLAINLCWYDKIYPLLSLIKSVFYRRKKFSAHFAIERLQDNNNSENKSVDVIIPTIGRKQYLYDVLKDLKAQTLLPKQVVIIEQNPNKNSVSELDYLGIDQWPFKVIHKFINKTGACNARNIALSYITSSYVFFADDDIRFKNKILQKAVSLMSQHQFKAVTLSCLQPNNIETHKNSFQWHSFGSGCSIVCSSQLSDIKYNMAFENGFGEDADFGMQLRNKGIDIVYMPNVKLVHLKAPAGGFRTKFIQQWKYDKIQPKPSPTVMLNRINNKTSHQLLGYKTTLFFKYYKDQNIKNPILYFRTFKSQWKQSLYWANRLITN